MRSATLISWITCALAIAAVAGAYFVAEGMQKAAATRAEVATTEAQRLDRVAFAERIGAIAADTEDERAEIESFMKLDFVLAAEEFERVGARSGSVVSVADATPQSDAIELPGGGKLQWVSFTIAAEGTYASLIRALKLYESLPAAIEVAQIDLEKIGNTDQWVMTLRVHILAITTDV